MEAISLSQITAVNQISMLCLLSVFLFSQTDKKQSQDVPEEPVGGKQAAGDRPILY